ncbi:MAG: DUF4271 domain-containing protein [Tannerellaceae bacterium]|nr:DUF4271 domain-containing protein [Tannerellaceae bacterium]
MEDLFEGYIGIRLGEGQMVNDILFALLLFLLIAFAMVFRSNFSLFVKMLKDIGNQKERQNLFEDISGNEFFFSKFMIFQPLFLSTIAIFSLVRTRQGEIMWVPPETIFILLGLIFTVLTGFYCFKQGLYKILGYVFADSEKYKLWKTNYNAVMGSWGILLYFPVMWLVFVDSYVLAPILLFLFFYFLCRFVIIYNTIRIFYRENTGILYLSLYLCGQEILPLIFLYQGIIYLYNFIEASTLWH